MLDEQQLYDVKIDYLLCLFEIGRYEYFLGKVDEMIEVVIIENIYDYDGMNIYNELLFKKSACLYNTNKLLASETVLKSLIKLEPDNTNARNLYTKCKRKRVSPQNETVRAIAMVLLLSALSICFMEILIVKPFYNELVAEFSTMRTLFFALAGTILVGSELYFKYNVGKDIGYRLQLKEKIKSVNNWFLKQSGGKIGNDAL